MKKYLLFFILIYFILILLPLAASAIEYPFGTLGANPTPCEYMKTVFVWGLGIVGAAAVAAIAYGGFRYMVGNVQPGKEIIYSALLGLLLLMASWLILYTINPDLATMKCNLPSTGTTSTTGTPTSGTPSSGTPSTGTPSSGSNLSDQSVRDELSADSSSKITENKTCGPAKESNTTCVDGLQQTTIDGVENIQKNCGCDVVITGGTEDGHGSGTYSHGNGYKTDLRPSSELNNYVYGQINTSSPTPDKNYTGKDGNVYRYETAGGSHWDVCYSCK